MRISDLAKPNSLSRLLLIACLGTTAFACGEDDDDDAVASDTAGTDADDDTEGTNAGASGTGAGSDNAADTGGADVPSGTADTNSAEAETTAEEDATDEPDDPNPGEPLSLTILHVNDVHSHVAAETFDFPVADLGLTTSSDEAGTVVAEVEVTYGGMPMLATQFATLAADSENVIKLNAGDAVTGTLYYSLFGGEADAALMNEICFDAFALGNHEFDDGDTALSGFLDDLNSDDCGTPVLAANVVPGPDSALSEGYLQPYTLIDVGGQQVAVIGIDIAGKTKNSSRPDDETEFLDELETAQMYIDALAADGIDKIILLTHVGYEFDLTLAAALSGVDVVVGGDSHSLLGGAALSTLGFQSSGDYPTEVTDKDGNPVCVVQAWEYGHLLGKLKVEFDAAGVVSACAGAPVMPIEDSYRYTFTSGEGDAAVEETRQLSGDDAAAVTAALTAIPEIVVSLPDASAQAVLDGFTEQQSGAVETVIGTVDTDLCLVRWPGETRSAICDRTATYLHGSDISNLVAKAFMTMTPTADIGIQNGGGVRVDVPVGEYTIADAYALLPFSNTLVTLDMTGEEIIAVLEDALSNHLDDTGSSGSYPYASGLRYDVNASAAFGARITNVEVNPRVAGDWQAIDPAATYTVVTNDFIASGQDGYDTFQLPFDEGRYVDTFTAYAQGFMNYVELESAADRVITKLPEAEYSTQRYTGRDGCDHSSSADCVDY